MNEKNLCVASQVIEMSETDSYIDLVDRVCFYDHPNLNSVQLDYDESSYEKAQTLVNQPVLAYYKTDEFGNPTLGGHEMRVNNGKVSFATQAIGTHLDARIEDAEVELVDGTMANAKCLFSTIRLWKRFENCVSAARSLFEKGKLYNSWEIMPSEVFYDDNNIRHLKSYAFVGNCLLGTAYPAYGKASHVYQVAEEDDDPQLLIAEALSADLLGSDSASNINQLDDTKSDRKEMTPKMEANENIVVENSEVEIKEEVVETVIEETVEETAEVNTEEVENSEEAEVSEENPVSDDAQADNTEVEASEDVDTENTEAEEQEEVSAKQTSEDVNRKLWEAVDKLRDDRGDWYYIAMYFPEEHTILVQSNRMPKLVFVQYSYEITDDEAVLSNKQDVEMTISPLNINSEIESKNNALAEANSRIEELSKCKEELDKIKAEQASAERAEAVNKLRDYVIKSGRFTDEEIASEEVQKAINELNEAWIKAEIADRLVASMTGDKEKATETSEAKIEDNTVSILLSESSGKNVVTPDDVMNKFFNRD